MPPKPKRLPHPVQQHLKHSRQLLEDVLYQYLPQLSGLGAISRLTLYSWFRGRWGLSADASAGIPYMMLEALRLQRQHLLQQKLALKPLGLSLLGPADDALQTKVLPLLETLNKQSHTAKVNSIFGPWQEVLKSLNPLLQRQPATERNLLVLDPLELGLPPLKDLLSLLPRRLDVFMVLPAAALTLAYTQALSADEAIQAQTAAADKNPLHESVQELAVWLMPFFTTDQQAAPEEVTSAYLIKQFKESLAASCKRYAVHYHPTAESPLLLIGLTSDTLMAEKMLLAKAKLVRLTLEEKLAGNQLGLFNSGTQEAGVLAEELEAEITSLLARQPEWDNQALYNALLHAEILPQQAIPVVEQLITQKKLEVLDEKRKKTKAIAPLPLNQTAYKLPAPSRYFRLKP